MKIPNNYQIENLRKHRFRPEVVGCFVNLKKQILLVYKKEHDLWQLPQGGIEKNENIIKALKREMSEELGKDFLKNCQLPDNPIVAIYLAEFPPQKTENEDLFADKQRKTPLRGKTTFFVF